MTCTSPFLEPCFLVSPCQLTTVYGESRVACSSHVKLWWEPGKSFLRLVPRVRLIDILIDYHLSIGIICNSIIGSITRNNGQKHWILRCRPHVPGKGRISRMKLEMVRRIRRWKEMYKYFNVRLDVKKHTKTSKT